MAETVTNARVLTISEAVRLGMVCQTAERGSHVARLIPDGELGAGLVVDGTARSIGDLGGNFAGPTDDVRDCYLRVTTTAGFEAYWLVSELMDEIASGTFAPNYAG
jgi:hypothetical protein